MGEIFEDIDTELEQKGNKIEVSENKIGTPDCKVIKGLKRLALNKISSKRKGDRNMDRVIIPLNNHKYIENRKQHF